MCVLVKLVVDRGGADHQGLGWWVNFDYGVIDTYGEAARWLRDRETQGLRSYERPISLRDERLTLASQQDLPFDNGLNGVTLSKLLKMVQKRMQLQMLTTPAANASLRGHVITVAEKVSYLRKRLNKLKGIDRIPLGDEFVNAATRSRTELVVLFLAVLEVIRRKLGTAEQDDLFGEIWLVRISSTSSR